MPGRLVPLAIVLVALPALAQDDGKRFGVAPDEKTYPQATAKDTLASVLQAVEDKRHDYLLAHLLDPKHVDDRVKNYGGNFALLVEETRAKLDPAAVKQLTKLQKDGEWSEPSKDRARLALKDVKDRSLTFAKVGGRWFVLNQYGDEPKKDNPEE